MTADELALWLAKAVTVKRGAKRPCADCPRQWAEEQDGCNGRPESKGGRLPGDGRGRLW